MLQPKPARLDQVVRDIVAEDLQGTLDPGACCDRCAGRAPQVRIVEIGQPVCGWLQGSTITSPKQVSNKSLMPSAEAPLTGNSTILCFL